MRAPQWHFVLRAINTRIGLSSLKLLSKEGTDLRFITTPKKPSKIFLFNTKGFVYFHLLLSFFFSFHCFVCSFLSFEASFLFSFLSVVLTRTALFFSIPPFTFLLSLFFSFNIHCLPPFLRFLLVNFQFGNCFKPERKNYVLQLFER